MSVRESREVAHIEEVSDSLFRVGLESAIHKEILRRHQPHSKEGRRHTLTTLLDRSN